MKVVVPFHMSPARMSAMNFAFLFAALMRGRATLVTPQGYRDEDLAPVIQEQLGHTPSNFDYTSDVAARLLTMDGGEIIYVSGTNFETARAEAPRGAHLFFNQGADGSHTFMEKLRIAIPFGDGESALESARVAIAIIKKAGAGELVLLHTTYRNEAVDSNDPRDHMNGGAKSIELKLLELARLANIPVETTVAMAKDLVHFVIEASIEAGCTVIATAEGESLAGSYAEQIATQVHLPTLVIRKEVAS